jgi:lipopolysaccharide exporter
LSNAADGLAGRSLNALAWGYLGAAFRAGSAFIVQVCLARLLGPVAFGQANAALLVASLGWLLAEGGFGAALVQRAQHDDRAVGFAITCIGVTSLVLALSGVLLADRLAGALGDASLAPLLAAAALLVPIQALSSISASLLRRDLRYRRLQTIQLGSYVLGYGVGGIAAALSGAGAWSLIIAFGLQSVMALFASYAATRHTLRPTLIVDRPLLKVGLGVSAANVANWAIENLDRVLIVRWWGAATLGAYVAAGNLARAPATLLGGAMSSVALAAGARVQFDHRRLGRGYLVMLAAVAMVAVPLFAWLAMNALAVIGLVFGNRWTAAGPLLAAWAMAMPFHVALLLTGPTLLATGAAQVEWRVQLVAAACMAAVLGLGAGQPITVIVWLVPLVYALRCGLLYRALAQRIGLATRSTLAALAGAGLLAALVAVVCLVTRLLVTPGWLQLLVSATATIGASLALLRWQARWLLSADLRAALLGHADTLPIAARVCQFSRLNKDVP